MGQAMWFWRKSRHPVDERFEPVFRFVCEQDGVPERDLKRALAAEFERFPRIKWAYLVHVALKDESRRNVALCLAAPRDKRLLEVIAGVYAALFNKSQQLDILFLDSEREAELVQVCRPFYTAD